MRRNYLFQDGSISHVLDAHAGKCREKVDAISRDRFLATPVDDLVEFIVADMTVEPLTIYEDRKTREQTEIFNKHVARFSDLLEKTHPTLESHPRYMKTIGVGSDTGEWRIIVRSKDDDARLIHVHVFVFNLYFGDTKQKTKSRVEGK